MCRQGCYWKAILYLFVLQTISNNTLSNRHKNSHIKIKYINGWCTKFRNTSYTLQIYIILCCVSVKSIFSALMFSSTISHLYLCRSTVLKTVFQYVVAVYASIHEWLLIWPFFYYLWFKVFYGDLNEQSKKVFLKLCKELHSIPYSRCLDRSVFFLITIEEWWSVHL